MYRAAGATIPPSAAAIENAAIRGRLSSPRNSSRLSSSATTKKNRVMNPSLTHSRDERRNSNDPIRRPTGSSHVRNGMRPGRIREQQSSDRGEKQQPSAEGFDAKEPPHRLRQPVHEPRGQPREPGIQLPTFAHPVAGPLAEAVTIGRARKTPYAMAIVPAPSAQDSMMGRRGIDCRV